MPINIVLLLLLLSLFLPKRYIKLKQSFLVSGFIILFVASTPYFSGQFIKPIESQFQAFVKQDEPIDYIVVLGCGHTTNEELPPITQLQACSLQRLTEALRIFSLHPEATMVTSGYSGADIETNAIKVKRAAISLGMPADKIVTFPLPQDTEEEALQISPLLQNKNVALVTNASHMPRAIQYFINNNVHPIPAPTGFRYKGDPKGVIENLPSSTSLMRSSNAWYEVLGQIIQWLKS